MAFVYDGTNIDTNGEVWTNSIGGGPVGASGPIIIKSNGSISNSVVGGTSLWLDGPNPYNVTLQGAVSGLANGSTALRLSSNGSKLELKAGSGVFGGASSGVGIKAYASCSISNAGIIKGGLAGIEGFAAGTVTISNSGQIEGLYSLNLDGTANYKVSNTGLLTGFIVGGMGADTFTNKGTISTGSTINLGAGDDVVKGGKGIEWAQDAAGSDKYTFGGGDDAFFAVGIGANVGIDSVDGGAGKNDVYSALGATNQVLINLDTKAVSYRLGVDIAGGVATGVDIGKDKLKGFENAGGGSGNDFINGSKAANYLYGNAGDDRITGGGGDDHLYGEANNDSLIGGLGHDELSGGAGADTFIFTSFKDSTVAAKGRDVITDFQDGIDHINFLQLPLTDVHFLGLDTSFSPSDTSIRIITTDSGYTIEVDKNGDLKADMAIDVVNAAHNISWSEADIQAQYIF
jgi:Ca2+-binding RTX toxin-like protein